MLFNSFAYILFLPVVFIIYWILPHKYRWGLLLIASYYFYMSWNPQYIILIFGTTAISYFAALEIEKAEVRGGNKRTFLIAASVFCLGILFLFKYFNFFISSIFEGLKIFSIELSPVTLNLILPVGISFYTFQTLSYVIDVYRGDIKAEHHFGYYAAFISFFPQLVAGPIERAENLLPQIKSAKKFNGTVAIDGLKIMLWGYFKKIVVADTLAIYVNQVYGELRRYDGLALIVTIFFFSLQIYCDFSGYSSIAIGTAKLMGVDLMTNFSAPYFSSSIREFWKRWHISLSTWFRDYVYIPLGGNKCSDLKQNRNLLITFLVSGMWHGADLTFLIWGGLHGCAQIIENIFYKSIKKIKQWRIGRYLSWLVVFGFCNVTWVFFRAANLDDAVYVLTNILNGITMPAAYIQKGYMALDINGFRLFYLGMLILILAAIDFVTYKKGTLKLACMKNKGIEWGIYIILGVFIVLFAQKGVAAEFVYFQF